MKGVFASALLCACLACAMVACACDGHKKSDAPSDSQNVFTPESVLPAGVDSSASVNPYTGESGEARKGTVAATLNNIALLNKLLPGAKSEEEKKQISDLVAAVDSLMPSLRVVGMFDLFTANEWLSSPNQPGRVMAAVLYLKRYPQEISPEVRRTLVRTEKFTKIKLLKSNIKDLLK